MPLTSSSLYRDSKNFFRHELVNIVMMVLLISFVTVILSSILAPDVQQILLPDKFNSNSSLFKIIRHLSLEQQSIVLKISIINTFILLISNSVLLGGMICFISSISNGNNINVLQAVQASISQLPKLALQTFFITIIVQLGFTMLMVPGIILIILFSLSPIILINKKLGVIKAMQASIYLAWNNVKIITPAILVWLMAKISLIFFISPFKKLYINSFFFSIILHSLENFIAIFLIIYLYRLYILVSS